MANREGRGIRLGLIFAVPFIGVVLYMIISIVINLLFMYKLIQIEYMGVLSKALMFAMTLAVCSAVKGRIRTEEFINTALAGFVFCLMMLCVSIACAGGKTNTAGLAICVLISSIGCFVLFVKNNKYGKLHKKRRKHK